MKNQQNEITPRKTAQVINSDKDFGELTKEVVENTLIENGIRDENTSNSEIDLGEVALAKYDIQLQVRKCIDKPRGEANTNIKLLIDDGTNHTECKVNESGKMFEALANMGCWVDKADQHHIHNLMQKKIENKEFTITHQEIGFGTYLKREVIKLFNIETEEGSIESEYVGKARISKMGSLDGFKAGVKELIIGIPRLELSLISGICGLIVQKLDEEDTNIVVNFYGESSSGKTQTSKISTMFYGKPKDLTKTFNTTENQMEKEMAVYKIIPAIMDDKLVGLNKESTRKKSDSIVNDIFRYASGHVKGRMHDKESFVSYYSPVLITTEKSIMKLIKSKSSEGQYFRMFEIPCEPGELTKSIEHSNELGEFFKNNYGYGGEEFARWAMQNDIFGDKLKKIYNKWREKVVSDFNGIGYAARMSNRMAVLMLAGELLNDCFEFNINLDNIQSLLMDSVKVAFSIAKEKEYYLEKLIKYIKEYRGYFADSRNDCEIGKHLGLYKQNSYGRFELNATRETIQYMLSGKEPTDYLEHQLSVEKGEKFETPNNKIKPMLVMDFTNLLRDWREDGILISGRTSGSTTTLTTQKTIFKNDKQRKVCIIEFKSEIF